MASMYDVPMYNPPVRFVQIHIYCVHTTLIGRRQNSHKQQITTQRDCTWLRAEVSVVAIVT